MEKKAFVSAVVACIATWSGPYVLSAEFVRLGEFTDGVFASGATAISANGTFVAAFRTPPDDDMMSPYLWSKTDERVFLGEPPGRFTLANGVTDDGQLVVGTHRIELTDLYEQAFIWKPSTGMVPLSGLPGSATGTRANDITPDGSFIVGTSNVGVSGSFASEAFRISSSGELTGLGDLPGGERLSKAIAVSADGAVVTGTGSTDSGANAFIWTQDQGMVGLLDDSATFWQSFAENISADGKVIVGYGSVVGDSNLRAFRWTAEEGIVALGSLPGFETSSVAAAASGDGQIVVGGISGSGRDETAFVWDALHGMRSLQSLLIEEFGLGQALSGWTLEGATDISANGLTIVGHGENPDGELEAYLVRLDRPLTAPEPSSLALLHGATLLAALGRRRR